MDERLRRLLRESQVSGDIDSESRYLRALLQSGQITDRQLEIASYMGYPAAEQIRPYNVPYEIARLTPGAEPPEPPQSNWFCQPLERSPSSHDIAHLWVDNLSDEYQFEAVLATALLALRFLIEKLPTRYLDPGISQESRNTLLAIYENISRALIYEDLEFFTEAENQLHDWNHLIAEAGGGYTYLQGIFSNIGIAITEYLAGGVYERVYVRLAIRGAIDFCIHSTLGEELCQYLTEILPPYILGYRSLEEILLV